MEDGDANDVNTVYAMKIILEDESNCKKKKCVLQKKMLGRFVSTAYYPHTCLYAGILM